MSKLSYKTLLIIFFSLLISIIVLIRFVLPKNKVEASWWNDNWHYRKAVSITNSSGSNLTNFQISISIGTSQLIADGKLQSSCNDIRITDIDGNELPYWTQNCNQTNSLIWIKTTSIPSSGSTIYFYYGNTTASSQSDNSWMPTGGTIVQTETGIVQTFTQSGTFQSQTNFNADVLVVAGGGGGGSNKTISNTSTASGGGGAGGLIFQTNYSFANESISITVGNGGTSPITLGTGGQGENSIFKTLTAIGGGGGGWRNGNPTNGGSGGGVGYYSTVGGLGTSGQGNNGGSSNASIFGGAGGGGVGETGYFSTENYGTKGGSGGYFGDIFGNTIGDNGWFSGGGGGGGRPAYSFGIGGSGGGGNGGLSSDGASGLTNTGGGGGGSGHTGYKGGDGGSGIVAIKYPSSNSSLSTTTQSEEIGGGQSSPSPNPSPNSKLVAYWKFNEGTGNTAYDSAKSNNGVINGATYVSEDQCISGKCLSFNGTSNYVSTTPKTYDTSDFNTATGTISMWIKPTSLGAYKGLFEINNNNDSNLKTFRLMSFSDTEIRFHPNFSEASGIYTAGSNFTLGEWQHISASYDGTTLKIYRNGVLLNSQTASISFSSLTGATLFAVIGKDATTGRFFSGLIDEVKFYNTALSNDEIKQDYNKGSEIAFGSSNQTINNTTTSLEYCVPGDTTFCASPIAEWNFEENTGFTTKDTSVNNNNGTFGTGNSAPTWTQGKIGAGLKFNGTNNYVSVSSTISNINTISFWVKPSNNTQSLLDFDGGTHYISVSSGVVSATGFSSPIIYINSVGTSSGLSINNWNHVTVVTSTAFNATSLNFGKNTTFFNGSLDQIRLYNYARTKAQVSYDYNKGDPVAWWKFDECQGSVVHDSSGIGNSGSINIGPSGNQTSVGTCQVGTSAAWTNGASGKINGSLNFDGVDDYISIPDNDSLDPTEITLSAWIKPNVLQSGNVFNKQLNNSYRLSINNTGTISFFDRGGVNYINSSATCPSGLWCHVIAIGSPDGLKLYINGKLSGQNSIAYGSTNASTSNLTLGQYSTGLEVYSGQMDDVRIYNYALTNEQTKILYNGGNVNFN